MKKFALAVAAAAALLLYGAVAQAAEIKVLSAGIMQFALDDIAKGFERLYGEKLAITYASVGVAKAKFLKGEPADVVVLPRPDIAALVRARRIAPDSVRAIVRAALSIAVRKGQPKPEIGSVAAVRKALLEAKSIAYFDPKAGFADGILFARDLARLGLARQVAAKAKLWRSMQDAIDEKGADLLVGWQPLLRAKAADYDLVGPLPAPLQNPSASIWSAGAAVKAADPSAAGDVVRILASPESGGVFKAKGFLPPG